MKKVILTVIVASSVSLFASGYGNSKNSTPSNKLYIEECAACHMGYQAGFLPKRSWNKMMDTLEDHFGVDATFDKKDEASVRKYLLSNASDARRSYGEIGEFAESIRSSSTPLAISETPKFKREHRGIPKKYIVQKEVKSLSNCTACHSDATKGTYRERNIYIPNVGRWDD